MRILYVANARFPTPRAHGFQIAKMCEAFGRAGAEVTLAVPQFEERYGDPFLYYSVERVFSLRRVPVIATFSLGSFGFFLREFSFACAVLFSGVWRGRDVVFSRDIAAAFVLSFFHRCVVFEAHDLPKRKLLFWKIAFRRMARVVSTNTYKAGELARRFGVRRKNILVLPNGFDPREFDGASLREEARHRLGLPEDARIILYTGHLYDWKGAHVLLEAARISAKSDFDGLKSDVIFVGGTDEDVARFRKETEGIQNVQIVGHRPHREIPLWLAAADVLALPNSAKSEESVHETSPIKLFEYMAAGRPIVASDLPSIREIVSESEVEFVSPDNPEALARGVSDLLSNPARAQSLARASKAKSVQYTWENRAQKILEAI